MIDEDLHNIERMLDGLRGQGRVDLILPGHKVVSVGVGELGQVFSEAALFRVLRPTCTPAQLALCLGFPAPGPGGDG